MSKRNEISGIIDGNINKLYQHNVLFKLIYRKTNNFIEIGGPMEQVILESY